MMMTKLRYHDYGSKRRSVVDVTNLDFQKAFDEVPH